MPAAVFDDPDSLGDKLPTVETGAPLVEPGSLVWTRQNSLIRSMSASVVKSFPAIRSITSLPRRASLRRPETVIDPSGNASAAAVDNRIGASRATFPISRAFAMVGLYLDRISWILLGWLLAQPLLSIFEVVRVFDARLFSPP
jgi:hypothetical protein